MEIMNKPKKRSCIEAFWNNYAIQKSLYKKLKSEHDENKKNVYNIKDKNESIKTKLETLLIYIYTKIITKFNICYLNYLEYKKNQLGKIIITDPENITNNKDKKIR